MKDTVCIDGISFHRDTLYDEVVVQGHHYLVTMNALYHITYRNGNYIITPLYAISEDSFPISSPRFPKFL